jgi:hypothetical protein
LKPSVAEGKSTLVLLPAQHGGVVTQIAVARSEQCQSERDSRAQDIRREITKSMKMKESPKTVIQEEM